MFGNIQHNSGPKSEREMIEICFLCGVYWLLFGWFLMYIYIYACNLELIVSWRLMSTDAGKARLCVNGDWEVSIQCLL